MIFTSVLSIVFMNHTWTVSIYILISIEFRSQWFSQLCVLYNCMHICTLKRILRFFPNLSQSVCCANFSHNFPCWWLIDLVFFAIGATYACTFVHWNMLEVSWKLPASTLNCLHLYSKLQKGLRLWLLLYVPAHPIVCIHITSFSSIPY